jgi:hypothetical protein
MMIKGMKCWCLVGSFKILYAPCYVSYEEKGLESAAGKTGHGIK